MSSHQWAPTAVRPVYCCLADFSILNFQIASLFPLFLAMLRSVRQPRSPPLGLSVQGLAGVWEPPSTISTSTQVPTRNVSENDLSLVSCNLNRKKVNCTDNIRRRTSSVRRQKRQPDTKKGYDLSRLTSPTPRGFILPAQGSRGAPRDRCEISVEPVANQISEGLEGCMWGLAFHEPGCRVDAAARPCSRPGAV